MDTVNVSIIQALITKQYLKIDMAIAAIIAAGQMVTAVDTAMDTVMVVVGSKNY